MIELIVIVIYFLGMITVGLVSRRRAKKADDFFVAGRQGSTLFITGSLLATIIGGSAIMVTTSRGFAWGLTGVWWLLAGSVGLFVLGLFLARKVRKFGLYTLPELIKEQYDGKVAMAASILIVIAWTGVVAAQIIAAGKIMAILGLGSPALWMVVFTAVFIVYTVLGGQHAIIRTDSLQTVIIFAGVFGVLVLLLSRFGGLGGLWRSLPSEQLSFPISPQFGAYDLVSLLLLVGLTYVVGPDMYSRMFCARDGRVARSSALWTALLIIPFALAITVIGMGASALYPQITPDQAFPMVITEMLPPLLGGLVLAALLCAFMSSADTTLLSASTILTVDIVARCWPALHQRKTLSLTRYGVVLLGAISLLVALFIHGDIYNAIFFAFSIFTAGVILPVIAGFYKNRLKVTSLGALVAVIGGGGTALISKLPAIVDLSRVPVIGILASIPYLDLWALAVSALLLFAVSFIENGLKHHSLTLD
jgi:SSS family solute:Na+ symporter